MQRFVSLLLLGAVLFTAVALAQDDPLQAWQDFNFAQQTVTLEQLGKLPDDELSLLRGLIFGRHGRIFKDKDIHEYLAKQAWFKPNPQFSNHLLNETERLNLDLIREAEANKHSFIQPGDLRFWANRVFTEKQLGEHTAAEWRVLAAEVEAIHGKSFDEEFLQQYFAERYWYAPRDGYDAKQLTMTERTNLATILAAHRRLRKLAVSPGDMELFQEKPLRPDMLPGLTLNELRLMRNEFFARRGKTFGIPWLSEYFFAQPWYEPNSDKPEVKLTVQEEANVKVILAYENQLRAALNNKPLNPDLLAGLFKEDAARLRQEILARRGQVFKDKSSRQYFAGFDWYKANPSFRVAGLTSIEKKNIAAIRQYEKMAESGIITVEG